MTQKLLIFKGFTGPITHFFGKATLKTNPTHLFDFLFGPVKKIFTAKLGQIVAKYDPNLAKFGLADLSYPWNSLIFIQNPSNSIKRTFLYAECIRIPYGPSERRVCRIQKIALQILTWRF